jgi:glyceraldehyde 3-phosphate dehydrogenase
MTTFAINGLGRIGKLVLRPLLERGATVAFVNDAEGDPAMHAHLLEFDSIHGRWPARFGHDGDGITIDGMRIAVTKTRKLEELPLSGVDVLIDCTGANKSEARLAPAFAAGVRRVVVSAPVKDKEAANIVWGVNEGIFDPARHRIVSAASCTTNCLAPVVKVLHDALGIRHGSITTIHDVTNSQTIIDRPAKDLRRARSALLNLIPTSTGAATAIGQIYPELEGRLNGHAVRVPLLNASLTDCVFEVERDTSVEEVNDLFRAAADGPLKGILGYEDRPLVSTDFRSDTRSSIVDGPSTMVVNGTHVKIYAWYDNEMGYAHRLVDVAMMAAAPDAQVRLGRQ